MIHLVAAAVIALLAFTLLMCFSKPFNRAVARLCGAKIGMSFSAHLWVTEQFGGKLGELLRPPVDALFRVFANQHDHCKTAWLREVGAP
jgi:hypothetical protein